MLSESPQLAELYPVHWWEPLQREAKLNGPLPLSLRAFLREKGESPLLLAGWFQQLQRGAMLNGPVPGLRSLTKPILLHEDHLLHVGNFVDLWMALPGCCPSTPTLDGT